MSNTKQHIWYSGDWNETGNNPTAPYNGLTIEAVANYGTTGSPPSSRKLLSVDLTVTDFTYNPNGVSSSFTINKSGQWVPIPIPIDNQVSPPVINPEFTVSSIDSSGPGTVRLDAQSSGTYLNIQFRYGMKEMTREELGYIMRFDLNNDDVEVEG